MLNQLSDFSVPAPRIIPRSRTFRKPVYPTRAKSVSKERAFVILNPAHFAGVQDLNVSVKHCLCDVRRGFSTLSSCASHLKSNRHHNSSSMHATQRLSFRPQWPGFFACPERRRGVRALFARRATERRNLGLLAPNLAR